jgi:hypothetical protein
LGDGGWPLINKSDLLTLEEKDISALFDLGYGSSIFATCDKLNKGNLNIKDLFQYDSNHNLRYLITIKNVASDHLIPNPNQCIDLVNVATDAALYLFNEEIITEVDKFLGAVDLFVQTVLQLNIYSRNGSEYNLCCNKVNGEKKYYFTKIKPSTQSFPLN